MSKILVFSFFVLVAGIVSFFVLKNRKYANYTLYVSIVIAVIITVIFSAVQTSSNKENMKLEIAFNNGATLLCNKVKIDKSNFNYEFGTSSFMSKPDYMPAMMIYNIEDCKLEK